MAKLLKELALVIGNNNYNSGRWTALQYAINDAKAIADKLQTLKFEVELYLDVKSVDFVNIKDRIWDKLSTGYDAFVFYFAGHGTIANASDCLLLCDVEDNLNDIRIKGRSIVLDDFVKEVRLVGNQLNIFIVDACRTQYIPNYRGAYVNPNFGNNTCLPFQSFIAFGSSLGQGTKEIPGLNHGVFTNSILKFIEEQDLPIESLFKKVRNDIYTGCGKQLPWDYSCLVNTFCFNYGQNNRYFDKSYSQYAYEDEYYVSKIEKVNEIISKFKSYNYDTQVLGLHELQSNFKFMQKDDLFVLGRNILQAADGNCWECQREISVQALRKYTISGSNDVLNGILFEMYFTRDNTLRKTVKYPEGLDDIQKIEVSRLFKDSFQFIRQELKGYNVNYIPGISTKQVVDINTENKEGNVIIKKISYRKKDITSEIFRGEPLLSKGTLHDRIQNFVCVPSNLLLINFAKTEDAQSQIYNYEDVDPSLFLG